MRRLFDGTALQQHRGLQTLSATWASCLRKVEVLPKTMRRLFDYTALQQHRGMQKLSTAWAIFLRKVEVLRRIQQRPFDYTALQQHRGLQPPLQRCSDWARDALAVTSRLLPTSSTNWAILEGGVSEALVIILQKKNYGMKALAPTPPRVHLIITSLQPKTWPALAD
jgi:hypothetical protein